MKKGLLYQLIAALLAALIIALIVIFVNALHLDYPKAISTYPIEISSLIIVFCATTVFFTFCIQKKQYKTRLERLTTYEIALKEAQERNENADILDAIIRSDQDLNKGI